MTVLDPRALDRETLDRLADFVMKPCTGCGETKALSGFARDRNRPDGRQRRCKACNAAYRAANRDQIRAYFKAVNATDERRAHKRENAAKPENRAKARQRDRDRSRTAVRREHAKSYRKAHADRLREYTRDWQRSNAEKTREYARSRRAREFAATVERFTAAELAADWDERGYFACVYCMGVMGPVEHADHILPLSKGGAHAIENLVPSCAACNLAKHASDPYDFIPRRLAEVEELHREAGIEF